MATLLTNGTLVDGTGADPVAQATVLIADDGSIAYAGPVSGLPQDIDAETVDVSGQTIFPGFIDCHTHLCFVTGTDDPINPTINQPRMLTYMQMVRNCEVTLEAGVTSVRDVLGMDAGFMTAIDQGLIKGPRLLASIGGICAPGGHFDFSQPNGFNPVNDLLAPDSVVYYVNGVAEARDAARRTIAKGAKVIKIAVTGGVASPSDSYLDTGLTLDEVQAIVEIANTHQGGIPVAAHCEGEDGATVALQAGVWSLEHGSVLTDEHRQMMVDKGIFLIPTLVVNQVPEPGTVSDVVMKKAEYQARVAYENFPKALAAGVKIGMGTDAGLSPHHGTNLIELTKFIEAGATPMQAVVFSTKNSAEVLRIEDITGTLEVGKRADIVVAAGDALTDFEGTVRGLAKTETNILRVYKDGELAIARTGK